jgi:hypothetical protein
MHVAEAISGNFQLDAPAVWRRPEPEQEPPNSQKVSGALVG